MLKRILIALHFEKYLILRHWWIEDLAKEFQNNKDALIKTLLRDNERLRSSL